MQTSALSLPLHTNITLADDEYRALRAVSNSDLTRLRDRLYQRKRPASQANLQMGTAVHQAVLEPHLERRWEQDIDWEIVDRLQENLRQNAVFGGLLVQAAREVARLWQDPQTGVLCKAKLDLVSNNVLADLKTTSCSTRQQFVENCQRFDYDRQAAFYTDSFDCQIDTFVIFGIQKVFPYEIFIYETQPSSAFMAQGRNKYRALLGIWHNNHTHQNHDTVQNREWLVLD
jgi:PDDEXK-like domain of unknown function (DUF3799)